MRMPMALLVMAMAKKTKQTITFASVSDAIEAEGKARRKMNELKLVHIHSNFSWELLLIIVNISRKKLVASYLNDWLNLNYREDVKELCRCVEILSACDAFYESHGLPRLDNIYVEGAIGDGIID